MSKVRTRTVNDLKQLINQRDKRRTARRMAKQTKKIQRGGI